MLKPNFPESLEAIRADEESSREYAKVVFAASASPLFEPEAEADSLEESSEKIKGSAKAPRRDKGKR